jgi:site-specific DNA-methyltransferase (adenine-specific)
MEDASFIPTDRYAEWFRPIWDDIRGASLRDHPAPFPVELASRLIRMFSFAGDVVVDPFGGTGSTAVAAIADSRSSVTYEVEEKYFGLIVKRLARAARSHATVTFESRHAPLKPDVPTRIASLVS